jgi:hypothetical protein
VNRPESITRAAIAAHRLYHHAVKCDELGQYQMARIMWAKYAQAASTIERKHPTGLMKFTHQRLF